MKITGADGRTHLSGPSLACSLTNEDINNLDGPSFSWNPYSINIYNATNRKLQNYTFQPNTKQVTATPPKQEKVSQSLPAVLPSDLKNAFEKIRLGNLKEEKETPKIQSSYDDNQLIA